MSAVHWLCRAYMRGTSERTKDGARDKLRYFLIQELTAALVFSARVFTSALDCGELLLLSPRDYAGLPIGRGFCPARLALSGMLYREEAVYLRAGDTLYDSSHCTC